MPRGRVIVRLATRRDASALARVYTDAFGPTAPRDVRRGFASKDPEEEILVAVVDGVLASAVSIQYRELLIDGVPIRTGGIAGVATRWDYRQRGLATRLMKESLRRIRARGICNTTLFTGHNLPAIRIYTHLGYSQTSDWRIFYDFRRPVPWIEKRFEYRTRWLRRTPFGTEALRTWNRRVLLKTPRWSVTITWDGREFKVRGGRRGTPDLVIRGRAERVLESFGNRLTYDRNRRTGRIAVAGDADVARTWRRIMTLEWRE